MSPVTSQMAPGQVFQFTTIGRPRTLSWATNGGSISAAGSFTAPTTPGTYTITADGGVVGIATAKVLVIAGLPLVDFQVGTQATLQPGTPIQLSWEVSNATTVTLVDTGDQPASGSLVVIPKETTTYTLKATNEVGTTTVSRSVKVARHMVWQSDKIHGFGHLISEDTYSQTGTTTTYVQSDQVGSPDWVTDASGALAGKSKNLPFGERFLWNGTLSSYRFAGHEDQPGSPIYMQARMYLPAYGRFASPDPQYDQDEDKPDSLNLYGYVKNNPVTKTDPTGMESVGEYLDQAGQGAYEKGNYARWIGLGFLNASYKVFTPGGDSLSQVNSRAWNGEAISNKELLKTGGIATAQVLLTAAPGVVQSRMALAAKAAESAKAAAMTEGAATRIGATGQAGEQALRQLGGESQVFFKTSSGARYVDQLVNGIAHESKVGATSLTKSVAGQIAKDAELIRTGQIEGSSWHFFRSPITGKIGPTAPLREALENNVIKAIMGD